MADDDSPEHGTLVTAGGPGWRRWRRGSASIVIVLLAILNYGRTGGSRP